VPDDQLRDVLQTLSPSAREHLRTALILDHADRDAIASALMRYRDENGQRWADVIDFLTMYPDARRRVVQVLGELEAVGRVSGSQFGSQSRRSTTSRTVPARPVDAP